MNMCQKQVMTANIVGIEKQCSICANARTKTNFIWQNIFPNALMSPINHFDNFHFHFFLRYYSASGLFPHSFRASMLSNKTLVYSYYNNNNGFSFEFMFYFSLILHHRKMQPKIGAHIFINYDISISLSLDVCNCAQCEWM